MTGGLDPNPCATCGHPAAAHIYGEGACRPGYVCPDRCDRYVETHHRTHRLRIIAADGDPVRIVCAGCDADWVVLRDARPLGSKDAGSTPDLTYDVHDDGTIWLAPDRRRTTPPS